MANEKEELLNEEIAAYEEELRVVASRLQEVAGVDCSFGACVFDPEMQDVEARLAELERRKRGLLEVKESLERCGIE